VPATARPRRRTAALLAVPLLATALLAAACAEPGAAEPDGSPAPIVTAPPPTDAATPTTPERTTPDPTSGPGDGEPEDSAAVGGAGASACADPLGCYGEPELIGTFDVAAVPEASGLAASLRNPDVLYLLDDRPGTSSLLAVRTDGSTLAVLEVAGLDARDTESLAIGPCDSDGGSCLFVGDIGDNLRSRSDIVVHRLPEPDLAAGPPAEPLAADRIRLRYPDGAHDAEALLVDDLGRPYVVTKAPFDRETRTTGETRLYRADAFADGVLTDLGPLPIPAPDVPLQSVLVGNVVTGGEHRDGRVLLRTYDQVLELVAPAGQDGTDLAGLAGWTVRSVPSPFEVQSEAITWAADGCGYLTAGEGVGDLWLVPCRE
jgi:hypothetical protein